MFPFSYDGRQIRQSVQTTADRLYQPLIPELIELVPTKAPRQRFAQAELASLLLEQGLK